MDWWCSCVFKSKSLFQSYGDNGGVLCDSLLCSNKGQIQSNVMKYSFMFNTLFFISTFNQRTKEKWTSFSQIEKKSTSWSLLPSTS